MRPTGDAGSVMGSSRCWMAARCAGRRRQGGRAGGADQVKARGRREGSELEGAEGADAVGLRGRGVEVHRRDRRGGAREQQHRLDPRAERPDDERLAPTRWVRVQRGAEVRGRPAVPRHQLLSLGGTMHHAVHLASAAPVG